MSFQTWRIPFYRHLIRGSLGTSTIWHHWGILITWVSSCFYRQMDLKILCKRMKGDLIQRKTKRAVHRIQPESISRTEGPIFTYKLLPDNWEQNLWRTVYLRPMHVYNWDKRIWWLTALNAAVKSSNRKVT